MAGKQLTLSQVKAKSKEIDKMEKYEITEGQDAGKTISFYPIFSYTKIEELLTELQKVFIEAKEKEITISEEMNIYLIQLMMIKHFTHFKKQMPDTLIGEGKKEGLIDWLEHFRKTGLFKLILEEVFLPTETKKVFSSLTDFLSKSIVYSDIESEMNRKVQDLKLKNKDVISQIRNIDAESKPLN